MEDLNDSLEDYEANEGIPTVISRNTTGMEDYHMDDMRTQNPVNMMQTGPFMVQEARVNTEGDFDFTRLGLEDNQSRSHMGYRRSGPEGSPAFNTSSGFMPQKTTDEESVIFRPVGQLDFSALDDTERNEDLVGDRSVSTPQKNYPQMPQIAAEREEVYGSQDMDQNNSRNDSPAAGFFEMNQSPRRSSESDEELNSRVVFSPLRRMENNDSAENIPRFEFERHMPTNKSRNDDQRFHEPTLAKSPLSERGKASPKTLQKQKYIMSPGEVKNVGNEQLASSVSPVNRLDRREVFVSIPAVDQHRESIGTPPHSTQNVPKEYQPQMHKPSNAESIKSHMSQEAKVTHVHIQGNASWDIPVPENSHQMNTKISKHQQKSTNERRPFVSSVRSETYNAFLQSKDSQLPRPKTKGSDAAKSAETSKFVTTQSQRQSAGEKKMAGPYPSHAESRLMARRNMAGGQSDRQVGTEQTRNAMHVTEDKHRRPYPSGGEARGNDHSPVHPAANVVTQVQHYHSDGEDVTHRHFIKASLNLLIVHVYMQNCISTSIYQQEFYFVRQSCSIL